MDSREQLEFDETLLPTKFIVRDERFVHGSLLKNVSLDNCFLLTNPGKSVCTLKNNELQLTIVPDASYPFLQVYTPSHRKSIAIENLSAAPNAFNNNLGLVFLEPNKEYHFTTKYSARSLHD